MLTASAVYAELPTPSTYKKSFQAGQQLQGGAYGGYGQGGYGQGSNQFGYPAQYGSNGYGYSQQQAQQANAAKLQKTYNTIMTAKDLLWVFTGNESTFGKRLFFMFSGALDRQFVQPIERQIGNLEYGRQQGGVPQTARYQNPYAQAPGAGACLDCIQQNPTNPYQQNPQAIDQSIFQGGGGAPGGIQR